MARNNKKQTWLLSDAANVEITYDISRIVNCELLKSWQSAQGTLEPYQISWLKDVRTNLEREWDYWNEEELKMEFVSSLFQAAKINTPQLIKTFYGRTLSGKIWDTDEEPLTVICDCMIASPNKGGKPNNPYFFFQEFKKTKGDKNDPEAQMLVAMLLAQRMNNDQKPIYGAWLQGRIWNFTILNEKECCTGRAFDATDEVQLHQIVYILQKLKTLILER
jgi:hypothetical protein